MARIVHVSATIACGIYTIICTVAKRQLERGHEVFLVGCTRPDDAIASWLDELPKGVRFVELSMEREIVPSKDWSDMWALRRTLQDIRPDIIHLHSSKAGAVGRVAALFLGARMVYQPNAFAFLRKDVSHAKRMFFGVIETALSLLPGRIVASSASERSAARPYIFLRRIDLVNNSIAVPANVLEAHVRRPARQRLKVGTCARVSPQKDPMFFAEVMRQIKGEMEFVWIGGGGAYREGQQALNAAGVRVTGVVGREDALKGIADLDIYIQTSAWEGLPLAVLEAMALGIPTVVRNVVGNRDLIQPLAPENVVNTPEEMVTRLRALGADADSRAATGRMLQDHVAAKYSPEAQCRAFERLYGVEMSDSKDTRQNFAGSPRRRALSQT